MGRELVDTPRVVVVTGAAGGIGSAIADRLDQDGFALVLVDKRPCSRPDAVAIEGDVTSAIVMEEALSAADELGDLYGLVNAAAVREYRPFLEIGTEFVDHHFAINVLAPLQWMVAFARRLVDRGVGGSIVNVTSIVAHRAVRANSTYAATKSALRSLSDGAALDLSPHGIRVNCVAPGPTRTEMLEGVLVDTAVAMALTERIPLGRVAEAAEIAPAVSFLLSAENTFMTGSTVTVDGGYSLV